MVRDTGRSLHDLELAALASSGDRRAFGELVRRHNAAVRGVLMRMGADPATADDVAQDAFITAFSRMSEFRGEGAFAGWIKRIAARRYLKQVRRLRPEPDSEGDGWGGEGETASRMDLDQALAGLPVAERICVTLCYGAGFSHAEAAAALEMPLGTVKSHVKRGLDRLRVRLAPPTSDEAGNGKQAHV